MSVLLRIRWRVALAGSTGLPAVLAVLTVVLTRSAVAAFVVFVLLVGVTVAKVRRRSLTLHDDGFVVQRDAYRVSARWDDVVAVAHLRRKGVESDELRFSAAELSGITSGGRTRPVPAKVTRIGADRRVQISLYDRAWRDGPAGAALRARGVPGV